MPASQRYQIDYFAIMVLVMVVLIIVFLCIAAVYFYDLMNLRSIPSTGISTFLFWTSIILAVVFLGLGMYALIRIFTYKSVVYTPPPIYQPAPYIPPPPTSPQIQVIQRMPQQYPNVMPMNAPQQIPNSGPTTPVVQSQSEILKINNIPPTSQSNIGISQSNVSRSLSDIPVSQSVGQSLNERLMNLSNALSE